MDAQPQRRGRPNQPQNDENAVPQAKQSLHSRHKSLTNMVNGAVGGLKAAAKRTAFADVSNTSRAVASSQENSANNGKQGKAATKNILQEEKPSTFLRPAQRPLHVTAAKGKENAQVITSKGLEQPQHQQPANLASNGTNTKVPAVKRAVSKRGNAIYKDTKEEKTEAVTIDTAEGAKPVQAPQTVPNHDPVQDKRVDLVETLPSSIPEVSELNGINLAPSVSDEQFESYIKNFDHPKADEPISQIEQAPQPHAALPLHKELPMLPPLADSQDCSEEEEDDEDDVEDDQGYTTAHSYNARGENTTGGVTTVLGPKVTQNITSELEIAKKITEEARTREEIEDEAWDTSMVAEYGDEIFAYMRQLESKMLPNPNYMDNQTEIQWSMRSVLMDWLVQVHHRFGLLPETLFLCVNYIDRFLSAKIVSLGKLQLVGATAIFVAAKYEEINCPSVNEVVYMVDGGYTVDEILKAERFMLSMLQFELGWPGPMSFLRRISKADDYDLETRTLAKYFLEVTIMDERFVGITPSFIAAGSHCVARLLLRKGDWSAAHTYYSGHTWAQLRPLVATMLECCEDPHRHHAAVFEKYSDRKYKRAALFVQTELLKGFALPPPTAYRLALPPLEEVAPHMSFELSNDCGPVPVQANA